VKIELFIIMGFIFIVILCVSTNNCEYKPHVGLYTWSQYTDHSWVFSSLEKKEATFVD